MHRLLFISLLLATGTTCNASSTQGPESPDGPSSTDGGVASVNGGTAPADGGVAPVVPAGSCASPEIRVREIDVGSTISVNEDEVNLRPLMISPKPSGGSRLAWMGTDKKVHVTELDASDAVTGTPLALPANDFQDIHADDKGGVLLLTRDAQGGGTLNCGDPANLCGSPPSPAIPCYDMYLVRFDRNAELGHQAHELQRHASPVLHEQDGQHVTDDLVVRASRADRLRRHQLGRILWRRHQRLPEPMHQHPPGRRAAHRRSLGHLGQERRHL